MRRILIGTTLALALSAAAAQQPAAPAAPASAADAAAADAAAWKQALAELNPLSPDQIRELRSQDEAVERAAKSRMAPGMALSEAVQVSMEPGGRSPVITLLHGFASAIEVLDVTGQPWPVVEARQGDAEALDVAVAGDASGPGNVITVTPSQRFTATNLILILQNASRPVSIILKAEEATATSELRDRVTLILGASGPLAKAVPSRGYDHLDADGALRNALVGKAPTDTGVEIIGDLPHGMRAWRDGEQLWIRTRDALISPAPLASVAMGDVRAYRLAYMPVIVTSNNGALQTINLMRKRQ
jgi:intracellular multiplication protein IcmK